MKKIKMNGGDFFSLHLKKCLLMAKFTTFFMLLGLLQLSASSYSQTGKFDFKIRNATILDALRHIEEESTFRFFYDNEQVDLTKKVTVDAEKKGINEILDVLFSDTGLTYEMMDNLILIKSKSGRYDFSAEILQQQNGISGTVTDVSGQPLPGVTVIVKGTTNGTVTNSNGQYTLVNIPDDAILQFSFVGMRSQEVVVGNQTTISVELQEEAIGIEEVVAVGYGSQKKSEVTSSISQVAGEAIQTSSASTVAMSLQGRASGVEMIGSGTPGEAPNIRIRGVGTINNSNPLIVLDGVPVDNEILTHLSNSEIQSIEILKDAASGAIYGTRAANGVVLVTTKKGRLNQDPSVELNISSGINSVIKKYPVTTGEEVYLLKRERYTNDGLPIPAGVPWSDEYYNATRTNWQDEFFQNGIYQDYNARISGGSKKSVFNTNLYYHDEEGTQIFTNFKRVGISLSATHNITDKFRITENVRVSKTSNRLNAPGSGTSTTLYAAYKYMPAIPVKNDDGTWGSGKASTELGDMWNPIYKATEEWRRSRELETLVNVKLEYDLTNDLTITANGAYNQMNARFNSFQNITPNQSRSISDPTLTEETHETSFSLGEIFAVYDKNIDKHNFAVTLGASAQENKGRYLNMTGLGFASVESNQLVMDNAGTIQGKGGFDASTSLVSGFIRGTYNYEGKYYLSGIFRADGSSKFAEGNRWGYFPSISGGWRISSEDFMEGFSALSNMKLNVGWGQLGNQNVDPFQYLNVYSKTERYVFDGNQLTGTRLSSFANPDITWETTTTTNILLEMGFLNNALQLNVAYFNRLTTDMLIPTVSQGTAGLTEIPDSNIGEMLNKGWEIEPSFNASAGDFQFNFGVNATFIKNEITKLYGEGKYVGGGVTWGGEPVTKSFEGEPISSFYGWKTAGIYQNQSQIDNDPNISNDPRKSTITPGDVIFVDTNGDHIVDNQDRVHIGDANPNLLLGINFNISYKTLSLSSVFSGAFGHELYDAMMMRGIDPTQAGNFDAVAMERWHGEGTSNKWPKMSTVRVNENYRFSELGLKSGNYMRMKDITLGYTIPETVVERIGLDNIKVYLSGRNLLTFTNFDGVDPEETGKDNLSRGVIQNNYPQSKSIVFGLDIKF